MAELTVIFMPLCLYTCKELKNSLIEDVTIKESIHLAKNADVILTSVGSIEYKTWENYLGETTFQALGKQGAVGHIGGHFYNIEGKEIYTKLAERMIGIEVEDLIDCKNFVCFPSDGQQKQNRWSVREDLDIFNF